MKALKIEEKGPRANRWAMAARDAVKAGAEFLDEHVRGWADRIDLSSLAMHDGCNCVLGQLFPTWVKVPGGAVVVSEASYLQAREMLGLTQAEGAEMGFTTNDDPFTRFVDLQEAWVEQIEQRRS